MKRVKDNNSKVIKGIVIKNSEGKYYGGMHNLVTSLHSAKIYRDSRWANEALQWCQTSSSFCLKLAKRDFRFVEIEIREL